MAETHLWNSKLSPSYNPETDGALVGTRKNAREKVGLFAASDAHHDFHGKQNLKAIPSNYYPNGGSAQDLQNDAIKDEDNIQTALLNSNSWVNSTPPGYIYSSIDNPYGHTSIINTELMGQNFEITAAETVNLYVDTAGKILQDLNKIKQQADCTNDAPTYRLIQDRATLTDPATNTSPITPGGKTLFTDQCIEFAQEITDPAHGYTQNVVYVPSQGLFTNETFTDDIIAQKNYVMHSLKKLKQDKGVLKSDAASYEIIDLTRKKVFIMSATSSTANRSGLGHRPVPVTTIRRGMTVLPQQGQPSFWEKLLKKIKYKKKDLLWIYQPFLKG